MNTNVPDIWDDFERWSRVYLKLGQKTIERMIRQGFSTVQQQIPFANHNEFLEKIDLIDELNYSEEYLRNKLRSRINFFRKYLVDISFDGPEFMQKKSHFILKQRTRVNESLFSIWLVKEKDGKNFISQDCESSFQCIDIKDVDLASMYSVIPYERIFAWRPNLERWDVEAMKRFIEDVEIDLSFDYEVNVEHIQSGPSKHGYSYLELECSFHI